MKGMELSFFAVISMILYFAFDYFEKKRTKDEREEWIQLKAYEWMQKLMTFALLIWSGLLIFLPDLPASYALISFIFCSLYGEMLGKIYLRKRY